jgi:hypothetical protein
MGDHYRDYRHMVKGVHPQKAPHSKNSPFERLGWFAEFLFSLMSIPAVE